MVPAAPQSSAYDVVIIGAGMGGLTAAALLSKAGMKVSVMETALRPGGYLSGFERNGFRFETAIHWLNQCGPRGFVTKIFDCIASGSPVTTSNSRIRRFKTDAFDYLLTNNPDILRDAIISNNSGDAKPVTRFFEASKVAAQSFGRMTSVCRSQQTMSFAQKMKYFATTNKVALPLMRYSLYSARRGLTKLFDSAGLRELFSTEDQLLSCLLPVGWAYENDYQLPPVGGSQSYPEWLCRVLGAWNTHVSYNTRVTRVNVVNGRTTGVTCMRNGKSHVVQSRYVIAACDVQSLYAEMLPTGMVSGSLLNKHNKADVFNSCITLSIGLDCLPADIGLNEEQILLRHHGSTTKNGDCNEPGNAELSIIASSLRDPTLAPQGKGTVTIYAPCSIRYGNYWATQRNAEGEFVRGNAYRDFKRMYADVILKRIEEKVLPDLRSHIEVLDIATPVTYKRYTGNRDGAIMGFRPSFRNIRNRVAGYTTPVRNLFMGGQWAELGGGLPVAVRAGMNSALLVLKKESPEAFRNICDAVDKRVDAS